MKFSLKELRARKNVTQRKVAEELDISYQTYNAWEKNPGIIKLSQLLKLCKYFEVSLDEIKW